MMSGCIWGLLELPSRCFRIWVGLGMASMERGCLVLLPGQEVSCYSANVKAHFQSLYQSRKDWLIGWLMLLGWTWFQLTLVCSLEKKVRTREACNDASSDRGASVGNVKSRAVSLSHCSPSGLVYHNPLKLWLQNSVIQFLAFIVNK